MIIDILSFAAWLYLDSACTLFATRQPLGITDPPFATHVRQMILSRMSNAQVPGGLPGGLSAGNMPTCSLRQDLDVSAF